MSTPDTLARMIQEREREIADIQAELDVLRGLETGQIERQMNTELNSGKPGNGWRDATKHRGPTRTEMLAKLVRDAGRAGLTRQEAISEMAKLCDSPPASVAQMLTNLRIAGLAKPNPNGRWTAIR